MELPKVDEELQDKVEKIYLSLKHLLDKPEISWKNFREKNGVEITSKDYIIILKIDGVEIEEFFIVPIGNIIRFHEIDTLTETITNNL